EPISGNQLLLELVEEDDFLILRSLLINIRLSGAALSEELDSRINTIDIKKGRLKTWDDIKRLIIPLLSHSPADELTFALQEIKKKLQLSSPELKIIHEKVIIFALLAKDREGLGDPKKYQMPKEEEEEALQLLHSNDLIARRMRDQEILGLVGEKENATSLTLTSISRKTAKPIHPHMAGEPSGGKSFQKNLSLDLVPPEDVIRWNRSTPHALEHLPYHLSGKILAIEEDVGAKEANYAIRQFQSEQEFVIAHAIKDPQTGEITTVEKKIKGPVSIWTSGIRAPIQTQDNSRYLVLNPDISLEQTVKIHERQADEYDPEKEIPDEERQRIQKLWHNADRLLKSYKVKIPYARDLARAFPKNQVRFRRDFPRLLALIKMSALLFQYQRKHFIYNDEERIEADWRDYALVYALAPAFLGEVIKRVSRQAEEAARAVNEIWTEGSPQYTDGVTCREVKDKLGWGEETIRTYLKEAFEAGLLNRNGEGKGVRQFFTPAEKENDAASPLLLPDPQQFGAPQSFVSQDPQPPNLPEPPKGDILDVFFKNSDEIPQLPELPE
ncbi:MAG: hypothetical protein PHN89_05025, partial [Candidatus Pacebacteria bacterium]|nr:hypothetical protein [Candidatus Paceibacterota bacterium]